MKLKSVVTSVKLLASKLEDMKYQAKSLDDVIRALKKTISDIEATSIQETKREPFCNTPAEQVQEVKSRNELSKDVTDSADIAVEKPTATSTMEGKITIVPGPTYMKSTEGATSTKPTITEENSVCADQEIQATYTDNRIGDDDFTAGSLAQPSTSAVENLGNNMVSTTLSGVDLDVPSTSTAEQSSSNIGNVLTTDSHASEETYSYDHPVLLANQPDVNIASKDSGEMDQDVGLQEDVMTMEH